LLDEPLPLVDDLDPEHAVVIVHSQPGRIVKGDRFNRHIGDGDVKVGDGTAFETGRTHVPVEIVGDDGPVIITPVQEGHGQGRGSVIEFGAEKGALVGLQHGQIRIQVPHESGDPGAVLVDHDGIAEFIKEIRFAALAPFQRDCAGVDPGIHRRGFETKALRSDRDMTHCAAIGVGEEILLIDRGQIDPQGVVFARQDRLDRRILVIEPHRETEGDLVHQIHVGVVAALDRKALGPGHLRAEGVILALIATFLIVGRELQLQSVMGAGIEGETGAQGVRQRRAHRKILDVAAEIGHRNAAGENAIAQRTGAAPDKIETGGAVHHADIIDESMGIIISQLALVVFKGRTCR